MAENIIKTRSHITQMSQHTCSLRVNLKSLLEQNVNLFGRMVLKNGSWSLKKDEKN